MIFSPQDIYNILVDLGITHLYHANSLITSCHYLKEGALLSRQKVDSLGFPQTFQYTDEDDIKYNVYNSVFLDSCDLHKRMGEINKYGPILFKIKIDILNNISTGNVQITKTNPSKWNKLGRADWFTSLKDVENKFNEFSFDQMLVFSYSNGILPLGNFLEKVIVDDPDRNMRNIIEPYSHAAGALRYSGVIGPLRNINVKIRQCEDCYCKTQYKNYSEDLFKKYFSPLATNNT